MLAVSFEDMFFDLNAPGCYKILRTWQVIDWCRFDPDNPAAGGSWTSIQEIKIIDNLAPVLTAPLVLNVAVDANDCQNGTVTNLLATATDGCNPNAITITNDYNATTDGTANGLYPFGSNLVTFTATDECGNTSTAQTIVNVTDLQPPTLVCNDNLVTDLAQMGSGGMVTANVNFFVYETFDNCTADADIELTFRRLDSLDNSVPTTTQLAFTCADAGPVQLEIYATDVAGNSEICITTLTVQDNNDVCPEEGEQPEVMVAGAVMTEVGDEVEETQITLLSNSNAIPDVTTDGGSYAFASLLPGVDYTVMPEKDGNDDNGVTTWDLVLIIRHIQNMQLLDSPYKIIAADANHSETVTMADVVAIKRVILGLDEEFTANNSWRFVDMYYEFPDPTNPWAEPFPEMLQLQNLTHDELAANFTAVKVGDVNDSASAGLHSDENEERSDDDYLTFGLVNQAFKKGETVEVPLTLTATEMLGGLQAAINFDTDVLTLQGLEINNDFTAAMQYNDGEAGKLTFSTQSVTPVTLLKNQTFMTLTFKAEKRGKLADILKIDNDDFRNEAYDMSLGTRTPQVKDIRFKFSEEITQATPFALYQNEPNPFTSETIIGFDLPQAGSATLTFYDAAGRIIHTRTGNYAAGYNEIILQKADLNVMGVVLYQLATATETDIKKMVVR